MPKDQRHKRAAYTLRLQPFGHTTLIAGLDKGDSATLTALRTGAYVYICAFIVCLAFIYVVTSYVVLT